MSIVVCLPRAQRRRMQRLYRKTASRIESTRCRVLLLLHDGLRASEVADTVDCVRATVYRTVYRFEELGEAALHDQRRCREPTKVTPQVEERLLGYLDGVPNDYGWDRANWTLEVLSRQPTPRWSCRAVTSMSCCEPGAVDVDGRVRGCVFQCEDGARR